jgi:isocitrate dehydrogenase kinase/phosphatase
MAQQLTQHLHKQLPESFLNAVFVTTFALLKLNSENFLYSFEPIEKKAFKSFPTLTMSQTIETLDKCVDFADCFCI